MAGIASTTDFVNDFKANGEAFITGLNLANNDTGAGAAIGIFGEAIDALSGVRAEFGAAMNRFDSAIRNSQTAPGSMSASRRGAGKGMPPVETRRESIPGGSNAPSLAHTVSTGGIPFPPDGGCRGAAASRP